MDAFDKKMKGIFTQEMRVPTEVTDKIKDTITIENLESRKERRKSTIFKLTSIAATFLIVGMTIQVSAKQYYERKAWEEFQDREITFGMGSVEQAVDNGYKENIEMEYVYQDGIGIKMNSLVLSDTNLQLGIDFSFEKEIDTSSNYKEFMYSMIIYDENNQVYLTNTYGWGASKKYEHYFEHFCKEHQIAKPSSVYDTINYNDTASYGYSTYTKDRVVANVQATSKKGFPKARKLKVQILDLRYYEMIPEEKKSKSEPISNAIWNLEIEVPEQFYQRSNIEYILEKPIAGIQLEKAIVSETSMAFIATIDGFDEVVDRKYDDTTQRIKQSLSVIDENGKQYFPEANFGCSKDRIETNFSINKDIVTEKLYLKVAIQEKIHTLTLIRKCKI